MPVSSCVSPGPYRHLGGAFQFIREAVSDEDVVARRHGHRTTANEIRTDQECLRQSVRRGLNGLIQSKAEPIAVAEQLLEAGRVLRR